MTIRELLSLLKENSGFEEINSLRDEIAALLPEVRMMFDYDQQNTAHQYDLWEHCVRTMLKLPKEIDDDMLYLAAVLHDIGKPESRCVGTKEGDTNMHYYGHPGKSMEIVRDKIIPRIGKELTEDEKRRLLYYVEFHDDRVSLKIKHMRRHLQMAPLEEFQNLMRLQVADAKAHVMLPIVEQRIEICAQWAGEYGLEMYQKILAGE